MVLVRRVGAETELHRKLEIAKTYAASHTEREQQRSANLKIAH